MHTISSPALGSVFSPGTPSFPRRLRPAAVVRHKAPRLRAQHPLQTSSQPNKASRSLRGYWSAPNVRILLTGAAAFARFCTALFCASPPMGSPSMSSTSRPDAIAQCFGVDSAMDRGRKRGAWMDLQGCAKMSKVVRSRSMVASRRRQAPPRLAAQRFLQYAVVLTLYRPPPPQCRKSHKSIIAGRLVDLLDPMTKS